jgi:hypothetical protein
VSRRVWVPPPPGPDAPHQCHCAGGWFNPRMYAECKRCRSAYVQALRVVRQFSRTPESSARPESLRPRPANDRPGKETMTTTSRPAWVYALPRDLELADYITAHGPDAFMVVSPCASPSGEALDEYSRRPGFTTYTEHEDGGLETTLEMRYLMAGIIGTPNIGSISGGVVVPIRDGIELPVATTASASSTTTARTCSWCPASTSSTARSASRGLSRRTSSASAN